MKTPIALPPPPRPPDAAGAARRRAPPTSPPKDECFWARNVTSFAAPDDHTVYVRVNMRDVYRLDLMGRLPGRRLEPARRPASSRGAGGSICSPLDAEIVSHATGLGRSAAR